MGIKEDMHGNGIAAARRYLFPLMTFVQQIDAVSEVLSFADDHLKNLDDRIKAALRLVKRTYSDATDQQHLLALQTIQDLVNSTPETRALTTAPEELLDELEADAKGGTAQLEKKRADDFEIAFKDTVQKVEQLVGHPNTFFVYFNAWAEVGARPDRLPMLYSSFLVTCVSSFEMLIASIIRAFYSQHPEAMRGSEQKYSFGDIETFDSLNDFREFCAEKQADNLLYGGLDSWIDWFARQLKLIWSDCTGDQPRIAEIFQRRNIVVHNGGIVNRQYLSKLDHLADLPAIGKRLPVDRSYCEDAVDALAEMGIRLGLAVIRKLVPTPPDDVNPADWYSHSVTYDYLIQSRYKLAVQLSDALLPDCMTERYKLLMVVNRWIAMKELFGIESIRTELSRWDASILSAEYKLAKLALTEDIEGAAALALQLRASGDLSAEDWLTWPLLREVRKYQAKPDSK